MGGELAEFGHEDEGHAILSLPERIKGEAHETTGRHTRRC